MQVVVRPLITALMLWGLVVQFAAAQVSTPEFNNDFGQDPFAQESEFLPVEQAFVFDYQQQGATLTLTFDIAEGYYLYKKQFEVAAGQAVTGTLQLPDGQPKQDEFFGLTEVYYDSVTFTLPVETAPQDAVIKLRYQGCADAGLCYPPKIKKLYLEAVGNSATASATETTSGAAPANVQPPDNQFALADTLLSEQSLWLTLLLFLALGIGLAFTPCVFPMYPILSGIVLGQGQRSSVSRAFWLSLIYVQGMALTYSLLGLVVASAGMQFQAALQHPAILITFTGLFVLLALAMFGAYELQLPSAWQHRLSQLSNRQQAGSVAGVFVMGALSGLIASPCTTAPLTGILLFIAQSGDLFTGFISLYVLSLGMGIPLILFGMTGGKLLPKAGPWMNIIKVVFGFMMLSVAIVFIERLYTHPFTDLLWAGLGLSAFGYFSVLNQNTTASFAKGLRTVTIFAGLFVSAMLAYQTLIPASETSSSQAQHPPFVQVENLDQLQAELRKASAQNKTVMLDLYADWCVACKEFEKYTFTDSQVINALSDSVWIQIDLTDNTASDQAFQAHFEVLGLPTILFFDANGEEIPRARVTGFLRAGPFADHVRQYVVR